MVKQIKSLGDSFVDSKKEILQKLLKVQKELKAPKNQKNNFGGFSYRSCEDILEAVKPLLDKNKLTLFLSDKVVRKADRFYVMASAALWDEDGEYIEVSAYAREEESKKGMDASQITGSASSYARKYALNGLFLIDDTKDADASSTGVDKPATDAQKEEVKKLYAEVEGELTADIKNKIEDLTSKQATAKIRQLREKKVKNEIPD